MIIGLIIIGILVSVVVIGNAIVYRPNAAPLVNALTIGGAGMFLINIYRVLKEKGKEKDK